MQFGYTVCVPKAYNLCCCKGLNDAAPVSDSAGVGQWEKREREEDGDGE